MRLMFLIIISSNISWTAPNFFNYQGRIFNSDGGPSNSGIAQMKIQILSPTECTLREETFDVDMEGTNGHFHISIGLGALTPSSPSFQFSDLFSPNVTFNDAQMNCTGNTYVSGVSDHRLIRVFIDNERLDPDMVVNSVPFALNSVESQKLSGKEASEFLQVEGTQLTQSELKNFFDQAANLSGNQSLRRNPANDAWEVFTPGVANSGVASVGTGAGLTDSGTANDPVLAADIGVSAGQLLGASAVTDCAANQKLQWTVATGWSCVAESDPTVLASVKDGVSWAEVTGKPSIPDSHSLDAADGSPSDSLYIDNEGNVGIGTATPVEALEVNGDVSVGQLYNRGGSGVDSTSDNAVDFAGKNILESSADSCDGVNPIVISNLKNGGVYSLILTIGTHTGVCTFDTPGSTFTFKYPSAATNIDLTSTTGDTIVSLMVSGNKVYVAFNSY